MKGRPLLCLLVGLGGALLALAASRALLWLATIPLLLFDKPIPGDRFFWPSLVYAPATLLLLADLRPRLTIKLRRRAGLGDTACPLRLP
jgi:hypothetical protein